MRRLQYLSPTSISKFMEDQEEFYMTYMADVRAPRMRQTQPMSIGSAFDAYIKSNLFERLIGRSDSDWPKFQFDALFMAQVEAHNRDWALINGKYVYDSYVKSGALADIFVELEKAIGKPRFEIDIMGFVNHDILNIPLLGKPDIFFVNQHGYEIEFDWKVNGYCSNSAKSPAPGYVRIYPGLDPHKDCYPTRHKGVLINPGNSLEKVDESWARQVTIYGWLCGCQVGSDFGLAIDQVVCKPNKGGFPELRFAQHRYRSNAEFQRTVYRQAAEMWDIVNSDHYFRGLSESDSKARCIGLDKRAAELFAGPKDEEDRLFKLVCED